MIIDRTQQPIAQSEGFIRGIGYGRYRELIVGAGSNILFKTNREGCFSGAVNYSTAPLKWNNAGYFYATTGEIAGDFTVSGSLLSDDGSEFQTKLLEGRLSFMKSAVEKAYIKTDADSSSLVISSVGYIYFAKAFGVPLVRITQTSDIEMNSVSSYIQWGQTAGTLKITGDGDKLRCNGKVLAETGFWTRNSGTDYAGVNGTFKDFDENTITVRGGIITDLGT